MIGRPPLPGAPWLPLRPPAVGSAPPYPSIPPGPRLPLVLGPPLAGAPWALAPLFPAPRASAAPAQAAPRAASVPPLVSGPPFAGAPWALSGVVTPPRQNGSILPISPPPSPGAGTAQPPLIERWPDPPNPRARRFTEKVSDIFNALITTGVLKQTGAATWELDVSSQTGTSGLTGTFNSGAH